MDLPASQPIMTITADTAQDVVQVEAGQHGMALFRERLRRAHNLPDDCDMDVTFHCQVPDTGVLSKNLFLLTFRS